MAEFKKISETEIVEAPEENDTLVLISDGAVKQVSAAAFAASAGGGGAEPIRLINSSTDGYYSSIYTLEDGSPIPGNLYDLYLTGTPIMITYVGDCYHRDWFTIIGASEVNNSGYICHKFYFYDTKQNRYCSIQIS